MKKIEIITMNGNNNYGNKLQHFAVQEVIEKYNFDISTLAFWNYNKFEYLIKDILKLLFKKRYQNFKKFDKKLKYLKSIFYKNNKYSVCDNYNFYIVGSDQVWNSTISSFRPFYLLDFVKDNRKKVSFSASFGVNEIPEKDKKLFKNELMKFKAISVREDRGKEIIEELTGRKDVEVLVDPTMLLTAEDWDKVSKKPKNLKSKKYILNYFLGELSLERKKAVEKIAKENNCDIINLMDKNDPLYVSGPSEFLYLEKNAFLICTDSFHSSVFAILYNRPFVVFDREQQGVENMGSRLDTLISKFKLDNRRYNGKNITKENLNHDYTKAYEILENERQKSDKFLRKALDIED